MYRILLIPLLLAVFLTGCTHYARLEDAAPGMTVEEFRRLDAPCYLDNASQNIQLFGCRFNAPLDETGSDRGIRPYIVTFQDDTLTRIEFDEQERKREMMEFERLRESRLRLYRRSRYYRY